MENKPLEGEIKAQPNYLINPEEPVRLVDGLAVEQRSDGTVLLSLFLSAPRPKDKEDEKPRGRWYSYCQGRYAMSHETFRLFLQLMQQSIPGELKGNKNLEDND